MERMWERLINLSVVIFGLLFMGFNSGLSAGETMNELLPNGSFEWVEHLYPGWVEHNKSKFELPGEDPILPVTWNLDKPGKFIMESTNGIPHTGKYAFTIMPGRADWRETQISCGWIEVRPQDTYHISGFARGMGSLHFYLDRQKPEGIDGELLGKIDLNDSWQELSFTRRFPGNISQIKFIITVVGDEESIFATIDDVSVTTTGPNTTPVPFLNVAPKNDEETVLIDHYDGNFHALASPYGQITFIEGRFGKAIHSGKQAGVDYPNEKIVVPETGTVEFWFKPNIDRKEGAGLFFVHSGWARLYIEWKPDVGLAGAWDINHKPFSKVNAWGEEWIRRWSDRDWYHISLSWGEGAFRLFVDGLLVSIDDEFKPAQTVGPVIAVTPHGGPEETYNVGIDELRISKNVRYGRVQTQSLLK